MRVHGKGDPGSHLSGDSDHQKFPAPILLGIFVPGGEILEKMESCVIPEPVTMAREWSGWSTAREGLSP